LDLFLKAEELDHKFCTFSLLSLTVQREPGRAAPTIAKWMLAHWTFADAALLDWTFTDVALGIACRSGERCPKTS